VTTAEGVQEYHDAVVGGDKPLPIARGVVARINDRLLHAQIGNHVRGGRGMALV
jgi:predicted RNase H-like nuclease